MQNKVKKLLILAKKMMSRSQDPIHDLAHVKRVVGHCKTIADSYDLSRQQREALMLSAWWHDVGRTITRKPSFIVMPLIDDTISALMLWYWTIRYGLFGTVAGMATRIIFCKSMGTGTILTKIFLRKKNRILLDILKDADALDLLHVDRTEYIQKLAASSTLYKIGYKIMVKWFLMTKQFELKTKKAKQLLVEILKNFIAWIKQIDIYEWHRSFLSKKDLDNYIARGETLIYNLLLTT